jgi:hypothetical protein
LKNGGGIGQKDPPHKRLRILLLYVVLLLLGLITACEQAGLMKEGDRQALVVAAMVPGKEVPQTGLAQIFWLKH